MARLTSQSYVKIILIVLLAIVIVGVAGFGSCSVMRFNFGSSNLSQIGGAELSASDIDSIEIDWAAGAVDIMVHDGDGVLLTEYADHNLNKAQQMRWGIEGKTLKIDYNQAWGCSNFGTKRLEILIPRDLANALGVVDIDGASGTYTINDISCDSFKATLASGQLDAKGMTVGDLKLEAASGNSFLEGKVTGDIKIDVASGEATVVCKEDAPKSIDADMASGSVTVSIPENDGFTARIGKLSGHFNCEFETQQSGEDYVYKGGGMSIKADMASGNFALRKTA